MNTFMPHLEALEGRLVPALWGNPWPEPERLTLSFAPDGTDVGGRTSGLFQHLDSALSRPTWQREVLQAFQSWAQHANINLSVVNDDGRAFGTPGPVQGAGVRGDIRLAAVPLAQTELAVATPFDLLGDWSGDVVLNRSYRFNQGGAEGNYDLRTVLLQEAGHVFGLPNSPDPASVRFTQYLGTRAAPSAADIAALQNLYGARSPDRYDAVADNASPASATALSFIYDAVQLNSPAPADSPWLALGDLTTASDVDYYHIRVPAGLNDFRVELRTLGISLLNARLTVFDSQHRPVASRAAADPLNGNLEVFVANAEPGATYYVRVEAKAADPFAVGAYRLAVGKEAHEALYPPTPAYLDDDRPDDDEGEDGPLVPLTPRPVASDQAWDYAHWASISYTGDRDRYEVVVPPTAGQASALVVSIWGLEQGKLRPEVTVLQAGSPLASSQIEVLAADADSHTVQVRGVVPGAAYEIRVAAHDPNSSLKEGNYFLGVNVVSAPFALATYAAGQLTATRPQAAHALELRETRLFHFLLAVDPTPGVETAVRLTIYNGSGQVVRTVVAPSDGTSSVDLLLAPDNYTFRFAARTRNGGPLPGVGYELRGALRNDPIGPTPVEPDPNPPTPPPPPDSWVNLVLLPPWLVLQDPYADPWNGL